MTQAECLAKIEEYNHLVDKIMRSDTNEIKIGLLYVHHIEYNNTYEVRCKVYSDIQDGSMPLEELLSNFSL